MLFIFSGPSFSIYSFETELDSLSYVSCIKTLIQHFRRLAYAQILNSWWTNLTSTRVLVTAILSVTLLFSCGLILDGLNLIHINKQFNIEARDLAKKA